MKKNFGISLDIELKNRLDIIAKNKGVGASGIINDLILKYVESFEVKNKPEPIKKITEEERIKDWEWRKDQVAQGKQPAWFGEEYPVQPVEKGIGDWITERKFDPKQTR